MANVRFLDQVAVNSYANGTYNSTAYGAIMPRIILPGSAFTVSSNTSVATYKLTVVGNLILETGPEMELPDGNVVRANSYLWVEDTLDVQGVIDAGGIIEFGESTTFASATII
jgi:hypothetical protein